MCGAPHRLTACTRPQWHDCLTVCGQGPQGPLWHCLGQKWGQPGSCLPQTPPHECGSLNPCGEGSASFPQKQRYVLRSVSTGYMQPHSLFGQSHTRPPPAPAALDNLVPTCFRAHPCIQLRCASPKHPSEQCHVLSAAETGLPHAMQSLPRCNGGRSLRSYASAVRLTRGYAVLGDI